MIIVFITINIESHDYSRLKDTKINYVYLFFSLALGVFYRTWSAFTWKKILELCNTSNLPGFILLNGIFAKSWMGRYIPGKVAWVLGRVYFASQYGIDKTKLIITTFIETFLQILILIIMSLTFILLSDIAPNIPAYIIYGVVTAVIFSSLFLYPPLFNYLAGRVYKLINKEEYNIHVYGLDKGVIIKSIPIYIVGFFLTGTSYFFMCIALVDTVNFSHYLYILGLFNFAGIAGVVSFFAPGGIGVRDGIQALFLALVFSPPHVLLIVLAARLWSLILDIVYFLISIILEKIVISVNDNKQSFH